MMKRRTRGSSRSLHHDRLGLLAHRQGRGIARAGQAIASDHHSRVRVLVSGPRAAVVVGIAPRAVVASGPRAAVASGPRAVEVVDIAPAVAATIVVVAQTTVVGVRITAVAAGHLCAELPQLPHRGLRRVRVDRLSCLVR
jgi:hypothetical protein